MGLTERQRHLAIASVERYIFDLRKACEEDQGTPEGRVGTVGYTMQAELKDTLGALRENRES